MHTRHESLEAADHSPAVVIPSEEAAEANGTFFQLDPEFDVSTAFLLKLFNALDTDGNGRISYDEMKVGLTRCVYTVYIPYVLSLPPTALSLPLSLSVSPSLSLSRLQENLHTDPTLPDEYDHQLIALLHEIDTDGSHDLNQAEFVKVRPPPRTH
eukprot:TRINITY_DN168_c0_g1_i21.p1 TRINITY_DN168_c0_g1~~TRINITY_DN168_c0_g1_i21.p1  ORF type:complete len:155 (+),score=37.32 TRINITY_DN168_c0_g1_i21:329-793(+)